jgi:hypothetical protein
MYIFFQIRFVLNAIICLSVNATTSRSQTVACSVIFRIVSVSSIVQWSHWVTLTLGYVLGQDDLVELIELCIDRIESQ